MSNLKEHRGTISDLGKLDRISSILDSNKKDNITPLQEDKGIQTNQKPKGKRGWKWLILK